MEGRRILTDLSHAQVFPSKWETPCSSPESLGSTYQGYPFPSASQSKKKKIEIKNP